MFKNQFIKFGSTALLLFVALSVVGCMTINPNAQWDASSSLAGNPAAGNAASSPAMDYMTALKLVRNWGPITSGASSLFLKTEGQPTSNEAEVTVTFKYAVYHCFYADTPNPVIVNKFLADPPTSVDINCREGRLSVWDSEKETKQLIAAWKTMVSGPPADSPKQAAAFDAVAAQYRADPAAFTLPEAARAFKVQAETAMREKRLWDAADRYSKALALNPSWAPGHFNLALIYGEIALPGLAMSEMKKYLKLAPDANNARAAQDKIYEWQDKAIR